MWSGFIHVAESEVRGQRVLLIRCVDWGVSSKYDVIIFLN